MDANKFTRRSQEAIGAAIELAKSAGNPAVEPVHLLSALLAQPDGIAGALVRALGVDPEFVAPAVDAALRRLPSATGSTVTSPSYARGTILALDAADKQAESLGDEFVSTEHLLVAVASVDGAAKELLNAAGVTAMHLPAHSRPYGARPG